MIAGGFIVFFSTKNSVEVQLGDCWRL